MALTQKIHDIEMWIISAILDWLMVIDKKRQTIHGNIIIVHSWYINNSYNEIMERHFC